MTARDLAGARRTLPLWVAAVATVLTLGVPLQSIFSGRYVPARVFIVAALVLLVVAATSATPRRARTFAGGALAMLVASAALVLSAITSGGAVLLTIAIAGVVWFRRVTPPGIRTPQPS